jgi:hypothetical protein
MAQHTQRRKDQPYGRYRKFCEFGEMVSTVTT